MTDDQDPPDEEQEERPVQDIQIVADPEDIDHEYIPPEQVRAVFEEEGPADAEEQNEARRALAQAGQRLCLLAGQGASQIMLESARADVDLAWHRLAQTQQQEEPLDVPRLSDFEQEGEDEAPARLVDKVMVTGGLHIIYGPSQSGKSWAAMDLGIAMLNGGGCFCGIDLAQIRPVPGVVPSVLWIYGDEDSRRRVKSRALMLARQYGLDSDAMSDWHAADATEYPLDTPVGEKWLRRVIELTNPTIIFIDTVSSATRVKVSDADEVKAFLHSLRRIVKDESNRVADIVMVHHTRKLPQDAAKTQDPYNADSMLGAGEWRSLTDTIVMLGSKDGVNRDDENPDGCAMFRLIKSKDVDDKLGVRWVAWTQQERGWAFQMVEAPEGGKGTPQDVKKAREDEMLRALYLAPDHTLKPGALYGQIMEQFDAKETTVKGDLKRLEQEGLVSASGSTRDRLVALTTKGLELARSWWGN